MELKKISKNNSGILNKFLFTLLFFSILQVLIFGIITAVSLKSSEAKNVNDSAVTIDKSIEKNLLIQASSIASGVEKTLRNCDNDLSELYSLDLTQTEYLEFAKNKNVGHFLAYV